MGKTSSELDFREYILPVAEDAFGAPTSQRHHMYRYGKHGSKAVDANAATWYDHESGIGGGCLDLVKQTFPNENPIKILQQKYGASATPQATERRVVAKYPYVSADGEEVLYTKIRYSPKGFSWEGLNGQSRVPYGLPDILNAGTRWIFLVEGEKDADCLRMRGFVGTCFGGASDIPDEGIVYFKNKKIFLIADYDQAGEKWLRTTFEKLTPVASKVKHCWLPNQSEKINDVHDWFANKHTPAELKEIVQQADVGIEELPRLPPYTFLSYDDILKLEKPKFLIDDLIVENSLSMLWGPSGSYKSFIALDLSLCIALNKEYHGRAVCHGDVAYLAAEGSAGMKIRLSAHGEKYNKKPSRFSLLPQSIDLLSDKVVDDVMKSLELDKIKPKLFVVDTLNRSFSGEENSASDIGNFIRNLDRIKKEVNTSIMLIHHSGKAIAAGARGSSALSAAVDTSIEISKSDMNVYLSCTKQKDSMPFKQISFEMESFATPSGEESLVPKLVKGSEIMGREKQMLEKLNNLLAIQGKHSTAHPDIPPGVLVVLRSELRAECLGLFGGTEAAFTKAFSRVLGKLFGDKVVAYAGEARATQYLWIINKDKQESDNFKELDYE